MDSHSYVIFLFKNQELLFRYPPCDHLRAVSHNKSDFINHFSGFEKKLSLNSTHNLSVAFTNSSPQENIIYRDPQVKPYFLDERKVSSHRNSTNSSNISYEKLCLPADNSKSRSTFLFANPENLSFNNTPLNNKDNCAETHTNASNEKNFSEKVQHSDDNFSALSVEDIEMVRSTCYNPKRDCADNNDSGLPDLLLPHILRSDFRTSTTVQMNHLIFLIFPIIPCQKILLICTTENQGKEIENIAQYLQCYINLILREECRASYLTFSITRLAQLSKYFYFSIYHELYNNHKLFHPFGLKPTIELIKQSGNQRNTGPLRSPQKYSNSNIILKNTKIPNYLEPENILSSLYTNTDTPANHQRNNNLSKIATNSCSRPSWRSHVRKKEEFSHLNYSSEITESNLTWQQSFSLEGNNGCKKRIESFQLKGVLSDSPKVIDSLRNRLSNNDANSGIYREAYPYKKAPSPSELMFWLSESPPKVRLCEEIKLLVSCLEGNLCDDIAVNHFLTLKTSLFLKKNSSNPAFTPFHNGYSSLCDRFIERKGPHNIQNLSGLGPETVITLLLPLRDWVHSSNMVLNDCTNPEISSSSLLQKVNLTLRNSTVPTNDMPLDATSKLSLNAAYEAHFGKEISENVPLVSLRDRLKELSFPWYLGTVRKALSFLVRDNSVTLGVKDNIFCHIHSNSPNSSHDSCKNPLNPLYDSSNVNSFSQSGISLPESISNQFNREGLLKESAISLKKDTELDDAILVDEIIQFLCTHSVIYCEIEFILFTYGDLSLSDDLPFIDNFEFKDKETLLVAKDTPSTSFSSPLGNDNNRLEVEDGSPLCCVWGPDCILCTNQRSSNKISSYEIKKDAYDDTIPSLYTLNDPDATSESWFCTPEVFIRPYPSVISSVMQYHDYLARFSEKLATESKKPDYDSSLDQSLRPSSIHSPFFLANNLLSQALILDSKPGYVPPDDYFNKNFVKFDFYKSCPCTLKSSEKYYMDSKCFTPNTSLNQTSGLRDINRKDIPIMAKQWLFAHKDLIKTRLELFIAYIEGNTCTLPSDTKSTCSHSKTTHFLSKSYESFPNSHKNGSLRYNDPSNNLHHEIYLFDNRHVKEINEQSEGSTISLPEIIPEDSSNISTIKSMNANNLNQIHPFSPYYPFYTETQRQEYYNSLAKGVNRRNHFPIALLLRLTLHLLIAWLWGSTKLPTKSLLQLLEREFRRLCPFLGQCDYLLALKSIQSSVNSNRKSFGSLNEEVSEIFSDIFDPIIIKNDTESREHSKIPLRYSEIQESLAAKEKSRFSNNPKEQFQCIPESIPIISDSGCSEEEWLRLKSVFENYPKILAAWPYLPSDFKETFHFYNQLNILLDLLECASLRIFFIPCTLLLHPILYCFSDIFSIDVQSY